MNQKCEQINRASFHPAHVTADFKINHKD